MVLYGGKFRGYPFAKNATNLPEVEVEVSQVVGGMCLTIDDWEAREKYIMELEAYAESPH